MNMENISECYSCYFCEKQFFVKKEEVFNQNWLNVDLERKRMFCSLKCLTTQKKPIKHKFNAKSCESDDIKFSSKAERSYYNRLKLLKKNGDILFFLMQVPFRLPGNIIYRLDFMEFWSPKNEEPGDVVFTEVKGYMTPLAQAKISMVSDLYGIKINIVK